MKAYIDSKGDSSVGIDGFNTEVDLGVDFEGRAYRECARNDLVICFSKLWGEKARVVFEDELREEDEYKYNTNYDGHDV